MKSKILVTLSLLAVLAVMASSASALPWLCGGWVKVDTTWTNGVEVTCIQNNWHTHSVDGVDYLMNPPQVHAGYFLLNGTPLPPAGTYTVCFRYGLLWKHVTFSFDGSTAVNLGTVVLQGGVHPPHRVEQER